MSDWNLVVKRLEVIYNETAPEAIKGTAAAKNLDDFTRLKQEIHAKLASARKIVKDVHAMQETGSTNPETKKAIAVQRHTVTKLLKEVGPMQEQLKEIQEKDARKAAKQAEKDPEVANLHKAREEIVKLVLEHMREVEDMSKRRPGDLASSDMSPSRRRLLEGGSSSTSSGPIIHANGDTELADFNCENELDLLRDGESKLDKNLDLIASGVANLKGKAEQMNSTLTEQGDLIDDITKKAGQVNERLLTMNEKLKKNVEKAMSGDKFVVNCVLITIILIAIGFTASQLT